ncbi:MAG TPA: long-chain-fatty-acid--CoA ligase [Alphaproteobacteria bacterium]|nr:long-chain-fatty-acid--CoA ligase [Alphaproteobacteria bacterium]
MRGLMQDAPLLVSGLIEHAGRYHGAVEIVTRGVEGEIRRSDYRGVLRRAKRAARALLRLGVAPGERIATLAFNTERHFELYFALPGIGAVCHTVNPRLSANQIAYIVNHAEDAYVFLDLSFVPLAEELAPRLPSVRGYVVLTDRAHMPEAKLPNLLCYEELLAREDDDYAWPSFDENTASGLCYTSGTTGEPKGVLYSHRCMILHAFGIGLADGLQISARESILTLVPMFHANAWGIPYAAALCGARQIFPGARLDGPSLYELIESERATHAAGVPTVWRGLLDHVRDRGCRFSTLRHALIGGAAAPRAMLEELERDLGVTTLHGWGMTEMSPVGTLPTLKPEHDVLDLDRKLDFKVRQGRAFFGVELKIVDDEGRELPRDGRAFGHLLVRGPWVVRRYFKAKSDAIDAQGWFDTGDVATLDADGYMRITDRAKDMIKSGGEWISSIELENLAMGCPGVAEAAAIGVPHPKWGERPLLVVVKAKGENVSAEAIIEGMRPHLAKWQLPDEVVFVDALPHTATGKVDKKALRALIATLRDESAA